MLVPSDSPDRDGADCPDGAGLQGDVTAGPVRCVLVIDDSALIRQAAEIALGGPGGLRVLTAASGEQGLELALAERPDAILLDLVMPGLDGVAVAERLLAEPAADAPAIVFLTASEREQELERVRALPIAGVIAKPFDVRELGSELAAMLGWSA
jgi:two-component system alkaline phosphatase synthesis response regulator PhoP